MMGVENNECVVATGWDKEKISTVKKWIDTLPDDVQSLFAFVPALCNGKETIILAPCGSKKGWDEDKRLEEIRNQFIQLIETFNYEDGSNSFDWVEVGYGEYGQKVLRGNCVNCYNDNEYAIDTESEESNNGKKTSTN